MPGLSSQRPQDWPLSYPLRFPRRSSHLLWQDVSFRRANFEFRQMLRSLQQVVTVSDVHKSSLTTNIEGEVRRVICASSRISRCLVDVGFGCPSHVSKNNWLLSFGYFVSYPHRQLNQLGLVSFVGVPSRLNKRSVALLTIQSSSTRRWFVITPRHLCPLLTHLLVSSLSPSHTSPWRRGGDFDLTLRLVSDFMNGAITQVWPSP